jgi:hypothetical protein
MIANPFALNGGTLTVAATTASSSTPYTSGGDTIRVFNSSANIAFIRSGVGTQTAVITDTPVAPNSVALFTIPHTDTQIGIILNAATGTIYVSRSSGA